MLGSYEDPMSNPFSINAMVCVHNEEYWDIEALLSAKGLIDEYVKLIH